MSVGQSMARSLARFTNLRERAGRQGDRREGGQEGTRGVTNWRLRYSKLRALAIDALCNTSRAPSTRSRNVLHNAFIHMRINTNCALHHQPRPGSRSCCTMHPRTPESTSRIQFCNSASRIELQSCAVHAVHVPMCSNKLGPHWRSPVVHVLSLYSCCCSCSCHQRASH